MSSYTISENYSSINCFFVNAFFQIPSRQILPILHFTGRRKNDKQLFFVDSWNTTPRRHTIQQNIHNTIEQNIHSTIQQNIHNTTKQNNSHMSCMPHSRPQASCYLKPASPSWTRPRASTRAETRSCRSWRRGCRWQRRTWRKPRSSWDWNPQAPSRRPWPARLRKRWSRPRTSWRGFRRGVCERSEESRLGFESDLRQWYSAFTVTDGGLKWTVVKCHCSVLFQNCSDSVFFHDITLKYRSSY